MTKSLKQICDGVGRLAGLADIDDLLRNLAEILKRTARARWVAISLLERDRSTFSAPRAYGMAKRHQPMLAGGIFPPEKSAAAKTLLRRKRSLFLDEIEPREMLHPAILPLLRHTTLLAVPMVVRNEVGGVVVLARSSRLPRFSEDEISLVRNFVLHAAMVANHIRLFDESLDLAVDLAQRIDVIVTLDEINKAISSSLSRKKILETTIANIERMTLAALVAVVEDRKGELVVTASYAADPALAMLLPPGSRPAAARCALMTAFSERRSTLIADLDARPQRSPFEDELLAAGVRAVLAIPLESRDQVKGVLLLGRREGAPFGAGESFTAEKIAAQLAVALENARLYEDLQNLFISTVASLSNAIDAKSPWTKGHSERVMHTAERIARQMGLSDDMVERVKIGGLLHDVGKIGIIEALLEKPDTLSEHESPAMRLHPEKGVAILAPIEQLQGVLPAILHHHERYDGKGYPAGLKGEDIPLEARIVTVADAFDAMVAVRPYKEGRSVATALAELDRCAGTQFDPVVVKAFTRYIESRWPDPSKAPEGAGYSAGPAPAS